MRAYSVDLRERVVAAVDGGMTQEQAAATFGVSVNTVGRYLGRRRATGSLAPTVQRHGPKPEKEATVARLAAGPPAGGRGRDPGRARRGLHRRARRGGVAGDDVAGDRQLAGRRSRSGPNCARASAAAGPAAQAKSLSATERDETARARWRTDIQQLDPTSLVFVDECGTHTSMTRRRARAPRGTRARGAVPRNRGPVTTLIAGLSLAGMSPAMTVVGGTTAAVFATYLETVLIPALQPGQVVVVDNVGAHKPDRMRSLVEAAGCRLIFLPAYSPDLSPVEEAFSKIKTVVKAAAARTRAALDAAIAAALAAVTAGDAAGWFAHAGYFTPQTT
jgi:transposase